MVLCVVFFFFQAEDGIRDSSVTGVQTCALPISKKACSPLPKNPELPARALLTLLGEGTRRPSKKVSDDAVRFRKTCWPNNSGQIGSSPFSRLRLNGSYQRCLGYTYSPRCGYRREDGRC